MWFLGERVFLEVIVCSGRVPQKSSYAWYSVHEEKYLRDNAVVENALWTRSLQSSESSVEM